jgi:hypothetical protein
MVSSSGVSLIRIIDKMIKFKLLMFVRDGIADERACSPDGEEGAGGETAVG